MHKVIALIRQDMLTRATYRFQVFASFVSIFGLLVPLYFVTKALDPVMRGSIQGQGAHYFAFVLVGLIVMRFCYAIVNGLPTAFGAAIRFGTLEAMFATPTPLVAIVAGMAGFAFIWAAAESCVMLIAGVLLGAQVMLAHLLSGFVILALILLTYLSFAIFGVALVLLFRTTASLLNGILLVTQLLGGIYYPTHVIPSWLQHVAALVPMTYGLRALRRTVLEGASLRATSFDLMILCGFLIVLLPASWGVLHWALARARCTGTLAQY